GGPGGGRPAAGGQSAGAAQRRGDCAGGSAAIVGAGGAERAALQAAGGGNTAVLRRSVRGRDRRDPGDQQGRRQVPHRPGQGLPPGGAWVLTSRAVRPLVTTATGGGRGEAARAAGWPWRRPGHHATARSSA